MIGHVDGELRALVPVRIGARGSSPTTEILAWVDTAFNGSLVLPRAVAVEAGLAVESTAEAILADGNKVELETFGCAVEWFGKVYDTQVVTSESEFGLVGTSLLMDRKVTVDYRAKVVEIE